MGLGRAEDRPGVFFTEEMLTPPLLVGEEEGRSAGREVVGLPLSPVGIVLP